MTVVTTAALLLGVPSAVAAHAGTAVAARPAVTGPVTGGNDAVVLQATAFDLGKVGYTQSEFFLSGSAGSYAPDAALGADGRWQVTPASSAPCTTRIVVNRPADLGPGRCLGEPAECGQARLALALALQRRDRLLVRGPEQDRAGQQEPASAPVRSPERSCHVNSSWTDPATATAPEPCWLSGVGTALTRGSSARHRGADAYSESPRGSAT